MMTSSPSKPALLTWKFDSKIKENRIVTSEHLAVPPGLSSFTGLDVGAQDDDQRLMTKRAWDVALGPLKQVPMSMFMMYMAGNTISLFPIMMVGMMCIRPVKALFSLQLTFAGLQDGNRSMLGQKFIFIIGNMLTIALALYKCSSMGLLPTHQSDWLAFAEPQERMEYAAGGFAFG